MFKKILFILDGKERKRVIFFSFFSILIIFLDFLSLTLIVPVVETVLDPNSISKYTLGKISSLISDNVVIYVLFAFNFIIILKNILLFFVQKYQVHFISEYNQKLQIKIFKSYIYQPISNLVKNNIAIINRNVIDLSNDYTNNLLNPLIAILSDIVLFLFILTLLIFIGEDLRKINDKH